MKDDTILKLKLYVISLWLLYFFVIIRTFDYKIICENIKADQFDWPSILLSNIISLVGVILVVISIVFFLQFKYKTLGTPLLPVEVTVVKNKNKEYLSFLATYIIPFVFIDFDSKRDMLILLLLLIAIGVIYVKTEMFLANPTLAILGYKFTEVNTKSDITPHVVVVSLEEITEGDYIRCMRLNKNSFFARKEK